VKDLFSNITDIDDALVLYPFMLFFLVLKTLFFVLNFPDFLCHVELHQEILIKTVQA
jgi:hypothetical protein